MEFGNLPWGSQIIELRILKKREQRLTPNLGRHIWCREMIYGKTGPGSVLQALSLAMVMSWSHSHKGRTRYNRDKVSIYFHLAKRFQKKKKFAPTEM